MKIILLDDEELYFDLLSMMFTGHEVQYEQNPVAWLDKVDLEKINLNMYDFIFCDYNFDNLSMNSFELNLSRYIREQGFKNYLILFSNLTSFDAKEMGNEYFDLVLDKMEFSMDENTGEICTILEEKCKESSFRKVWEGRIN